MKKTSRLKQMLQQPGLDFLMEAHNGISAKIAEEAGFHGIWGSGLSISASLGLRDNNEASWTQVLEVVEYMSDASSVPILLDGDTGYGNFNNMRRLVKKLEQRQVAGVCIEDKLFPKTNSFLRGDQQPLADVDEFCGKIKAGLDARSDDDFCIVARVEAFIAGYDLKEALKRANAYYEAGAHAVLIHSKKNNPEEIFAFMKEWGNRCPVVIVPTKYYATPTDEFRKNGISTVIWANHLMRSSVRAMQNTARDIARSQSIVQIEDKIVPVKEIFRLQDDDELVEAEKKYFQIKHKTRAIILAADRGKGLEDLTIDKPKALLEVNGRPLLAQTIDNLNNKGIHEVNVVRGYGKMSYPDHLQCAYIDNPKFDESGELYSLWLAKDLIKGDLIISYGDIVYRNYVLNQLESNSCDISIVVDSKIQERAVTYKGDFVKCDKDNKLTFGDSNTKLLECSYSVLKELNFKTNGEWIGLMRCTERGSEILLDALEELAKKPQYINLNMSDLLQSLIQNDVRIGVEYIEGNWMDIDNYQDYQRIQAF